MGPPRDQRRRYDEERLIEQLTVREFKTDGIAMISRSRSRKMQTQADFALLGHPGGNKGSNELKYFTESAFELPRGRGVSFAPEGFAESP